MSTDPDGLGLHKGTVALHPWTPAWDAAFRREFDLLVPVLPGCRIEHVGSTAVRHFWAKPILDIVVGPPAQSDFEPTRSALTGLGYLYMGDAGDDGGHLFVRERAPLVRTHHLHVVPVDGRQWQAYLHLRDRLRTSAEARASYLATKRALLAQHPTDRPAYTAGKHDTIRGLLLRR